MTGTTITRARGWPTAALEQFKTVGLAVRRESFLLCALLTLFLIGAPLLESVGILIVDGSEELRLELADLGVLGMLTGLVYPLVVWKGEFRFGESELWTLPLSHATNARVKIGAGWVWLMGVVAFGLVTLSLAVVILGGTLGLEETRLVATDLDGARQGLTEAIQIVSWRAPAWHWILPFAGATGGYFFASALFVGLRRPVPLGRRAVGRLPWAGPSRRRWAGVDGCPLARRPRRRYRGHSRHGGVRGSDLQRHVGVWRALARLGSHHHSWRVGRENRGWVDRWLGVRLGGVRAPQGRVDVPSGSLGKRPTRPAGPSSGISGPVPGSIC